MKGSRKPGWGWLCGCATCINCCWACPRLVLLTVLPSRWKGSTVVSRFRPRRSRLMPDRECRSWGALDSGRTVGASNAAGVEFWRRCCARRRRMLEGESVDSMLYAGQVRGSLIRRMPSPVGPETHAVQAASAGRLMSLWLPQYSQSLWPAAIKSNGPRRPVELEVGNVSRAIRVAETEGGGELWRCSSGWCGFTRVEHVWGRR